MKVKVIEEFRDKFNMSRVYPVGGVFDFEPTRAADIIARGLGEKAEPEKPVVKRAAPAPRKPRVKE